MESIWKSNKMPSWKAWVLRPSGLIKVEGSKHFYWELPCGGRKCCLEVDIESS